MRRTGTRTSRRATRSRRHRPSENARRIGPFEALALLAVCCLFVGVLVFTFSRRPAAEMADAGPSAVQAASSAKPIVSPVEDEAHFAHTETALTEAPGNRDTFTCKSPSVTDGDTVRCGAARVRLASIDAPELPGHCRVGRICTPGDPWASSDHLRQVIGDRPLSCRRVDTDRYGRTVAFCSAGGTDLSCAQVTSGHAVVRYGRLSCGSRSENIGLTSKAT